MKVNEEELPL